MRKQIQSDKDIEQGEVDQRFFQKTKDQKEHLSKDNELEDKQIRDRLGIADWNTIEGSNVFKGKELLGSVGFTSDKFFNKFWVRPVPDPTGRRYYFYKKDIEKVYNGQVYLNDDAIPEIVE